MLKPLLCCIVVVLACVNLSAQTTTLKHAIPAGFRNVNPDTNGQPWLVGGMKMTPEVHARLQQIPEWPGPDAKHSSNTLPDHIYNYKDSAFPATFTQYGSCCSAASGIGYSYTYECNLLKGVSAKKAANLCAYGFLYDFLDDGVDQGCWYYDAWDIAKKTGCMSKTDFGGEVEDQGETKWVSGYTAYHNAYSQCRDSSYYTISVKDSAGIWKLKQWMYNHGRGDAKGGTATFSWYSQHNFTTIPTGMPDSGKKSLIKSIITAASSQSEHAMTFAGYDDRIGESSSGALGAVLLQNSWGISYGDSGRSWVPYRFLKSPASKNADSTIYENTVYVIEVRKQTVKLDYKVTISHNSRNKIQIQTGYANSATATSATNTSYIGGNSSSGSAFNYSGGAYPMEGKGGDSTIEIGLDVTDFYTAITGTQATFFLMITSKGGSGSVKNFSLMDYTGDTVTETACSKTNVTITSNATTTLSIVYTKKTTPIASSARKISGFDIKVNRDNSIFVPFGGKSSVAIANMQGRQLKSFETNGQGWHTMPISITAGKYVVTIVNAGKSYSRKIDIVK